MSIRRISQAPASASEVRSRAHASKVVRETPSEPAGTPSGAVNHSAHGRELAEALYRQTIYDQPRDSRTSAAIATYREYAFLQRREEVQAMLHVSLYV
ncbi:hypothetical protein [Pseudoalteromonas sp. BDTF-M6]|uniref:hypothetical protein n=1 Tax=Pseudoalteromonas sp. BDTF-M6 TaxID=2796132 RepID=UPI001BB09D4D|nr:hypothetical protein [Pseudoalteromonas sp. BDTF-M6]MBS3797631.1 hypothetical protein [Pseudoalteromonas sp. BDTF-M6]